MRDSFKTDFAILNTGGVRAYISDGNVTVSDVYNVFPFNNEVYLVEIKGSDLLRFYYNADYYIYINKILMHQRLFLTRPIMLQLLIMSLQVGIINHTLELSNM